MAGRKDRQGFLWLDQREEAPNYKIDWEEEDSSLDADDQLRPGHRKWTHWKKSITSNFILKMKSSQSFLSQV